MNTDDNDINDDNDGVGAYLPSLYEPSLYTAVDGCAQHIAHTDCLHPLQYTTDQIALSQTVTTLDPNVPYLTV